MESLDDNTTMLEQLEREIVRWSHVVSEMKADDNRRSVIEAKLASWKQKR
jgi:cytochrome c-type biogenesis protein CcmH/NrfG